MSKSSKHWLFGGVFIVVLFLVLSFLGVFQSVLSGSKVFSQVVNAGSSGSVSFFGYDFVTSNVKNHATVDSSGRVLSRGCQATFSVFRDGVLLESVNSWSQLNRFYSSVNGVNFSVFFLDSKDMVSKTCGAVDNSFIFDVASLPLDVDVSNARLVNGSLVFDVLFDNRYVDSLLVYSSYSVKLGSGFFSGVSRTVKGSFSVPRGVSSRSVAVPTDGFYGNVSVSMGVDVFVSESLFAGLSVNSCDRYKVGAKRVGSYYPVASCDGIRLGSLSKDLHFNILPSTIIINISNECNCDPLKYVNGCCDKPITPPKPSIPLWVYIVGGLILLSAILLGVKYFRKG